MSADLEQLKLDVALYPKADLSDFIGDDWLSVTDAVRQLSTGLISHCFFYGRLESGKSHLLEAICTLYRDMNKKAIYLPMKVLVDESPEVILSLDDFDLFAIDDVHLIANSVAWQEAIFHLFNRSSYTSDDALAPHQLVFTSSVQATELSFELKDLVSRLSQTASFALPKIQLIDDRKQTLESILSRRNLTINKKVKQFIVHHGPMKTSLIIALVDNLQDLSPQISHQRLNAATEKSAIEIISKYAQLDIEAAT